jgi:hypothetical protein|uniref:Uncharacterized protein n=1 Tax=Oryza sativa subsp. japonica TaxID=39947 RepID=Q5VPV8_ORYSJ|nr:hypothetical protein [Oryza sativa Japonica Group]
MGRADHVGGRKQQHRWEETTAVRRSGRRLGSRVGIPISAYTISKGHHCPYAASAVLSLSPLRHARCWPTHEGDPQRPNLAGGGKRKFGCSDISGGVRHLQPARLAALPCVGGRGSGGERLSALGGERFHAKILFCFPFCSIHTDEAESTPHGIPIPCGA